MTVIAVLLFLILAWHMISGYRVKLGSRLFNVLAFTILVVALFCLQYVLKIGEFTRSYLH